MMGGWIIIINIVIIIVVVVINQLFENFYNKPLQTSFSLPSLKVSAAVKAAADYWDPDSGFLIEPTCGQPPFPAFEIQILTYTCRDTIFTSFT